MRKTIFSYIFGFWVLRIFHAVIGTLGNFSASIGKAKSNKTFNASDIAASALGGNIVLHYRSVFPENKRKILYIDTLFVDGIQLVTKLKSNMKSALMSVANRLLFRERAIIEIINDDAIYYAN